ncbi:MAG: class I SAM-dependent methyltransferase [Phycisphaerae bacterium]|jgi:SAM-dependent methyltransferase
MKTYQVLRGRGRRLVSDAWQGTSKMYARDYEAWAREVRRRRDEALTRLSDTLGVDWHDCDLLDVGCGQRCTWSLVFGEFNRITAIDLDVVPHGLSPAAYLSMWRSNGTYRTAKTIARKLLGLDRKERLALAHAATKPLVWPATLPMNAQKLTFPDHAFDGAFSFAVFEHIADPRQALRELNRVIRPGGAVYLVAEIFTSIKGSHDPRLWGDAHAIPLWAHLRPSCDGMWSSNVFVNKLRLADYETIARDELDDARFFREERGTRAFLNQLKPHERQELSAYTDEELCTQDLVIIGRTRR